MNYNNFNIKASSGTFYQTSPTPQEGFVANSYTDRQTKEEKTNYHREVESLHGKLHSIKLKDGKYGEQLCISLTQSNGDANVLQLKVFNTGTSVNDYIKSFVQVMENLVLGAETEITLNRTSKDKKDKLYANVFISQDGEKIQWAFKTVGEDSPVPKAKKVINKVKKTESWDFDDVNEFYYDKLKKLSNNVAAPQSPPPDQQSTPTAEAPEENAQDDTQLSQDETQDLPF
jgi:hypothetical protein